MAPDEMLNYAAIAELTGLHPGTLRRYRALGLLPAPDDATIPDRPRWRRATIEAWIASRPGRGSPGKARGPRATS